jgi:predicted nucleic acid-binding protein
MQIAIDSSVLVALINPRDLWRDQALALENALLAKSGKLFYFDCVVAEAISVAARRLHEKNLAAEVGALLDRLNARVPQETITWILPDAPRLYAEALALMRSCRGIEFQRCVDRAGLPRAWHPRHRKFRPRF